MAVTPVGNDFAENKFQFYDDLDQDEISKLINESYQIAQKESSQLSRDKVNGKVNSMHLAVDACNSSVIYKDEKVFDQPKKAVYGIKPTSTKF